MTPTAPRRGALATLAAVAVLGPLTVAVPGVADAVTTAPVRTAGCHELLAGQQGWVTGTVVNRHGTPIEGALVNALKPGEVPEAGPLDAPNTRQDRTADDGTFRLRQTAGPFLIQVCTPEPGQEFVCKEAARGVDFMPTYVGPAGVTDSWVTQTALFASTTSDRDLGTVTVKPQAFVAGRLVGAFFQPVQVQRLNGTAAWYGETDADGDYAFRGLAPGRYRIASGGPGTGFLPFLSPIVELQAREHADRRRHSRPGCPDPWRRHVARQPGARSRRDGQPRRRDARRSHDRPAGPLSRRRSGDRLLHARQLRRGHALPAQHGRGCGRRGGRGGRRSTDGAPGRVDHDRLPEGRGARDQGS